MNTAEADAGAVVFTLVAGLSSSGKSTWLARQAKGGRMVLPIEIGNDFSSLPAEPMIHYNTLRYADNDAAHLCRPFTHDPFLQEVLRHSGCFDLVYIAAPLADLLGRVQARRTVERGEGAYPYARIAKAIKGIDHRAFHAAWLDLLVPRARRTRLLLSHSRAFHGVEREELIAAIA